MVDDFGSSVFFKLKWKSLSGIGSYYNDILLPHDIISLCASRRISPQHPASIQPLVTALAALTVIPSRLLSFIVLIEVVFGLPTGYLLLTSGYHRKVTMQLLDLSPRRVSSLLFIPYPILLMFVISETPLLLTRTGRIIYSILRRHLHSHFPHCVVNKYLCLHSIYFKHFQAHTYREKDSSAIIYLQRVWLLPGLSYLSWGDGCKNRTGNNLREYLGMNSVKKGTLVVRPRHSQQWKSPYVEKGDRIMAKFLEVSGVYRVFSRRWPRLLWPPGHLEPNP